MSVDDWADLMPQTVTVAAFVSRDSYAVPTYATAVSYSARVSYKNTWVRRNDGSKIVGRGIVWLKSSVRVAAESRLTLPDGTTPTILDVQTIPDENGDHHTKIIFG